MKTHRQITILCDNSSTQAGVTPGHGLALLIESEGTRVLFDTGPNEALMPNAEALGVALTPLDAVVLSHGHYDHTGGLEALQSATGPARVVAHPGIFDPTYSRNGLGVKRYIGAPLRRQRYEEMGAQFELSELPVELGGGIITTGHVPRVQPSHLGDAHLLRQGSAGLIRDDFRDDLSLVVRLADSSLVVTGCAHAGVVNILCKAQTILPERRPRVLLGGLHLGSAPDEKVAQMAREAGELGVRTVMPCHCTGAQATEVLRASFPGDVVPVGAGSLIMVHDDGQTEVRNPVGSDSQTIVH